MTDASDNKAVRKRVDDPLLGVAEALRYRRAGKLRELDRAAQAELLFHALRHSTKGTHAIIFSPGTMVQITPYGVSHSASYSANAEIKHYLTMHADLKCDFLRRIFTSFELILFKICHIFLRDMDVDYTFEKEKTSARFKRVRDLLVSGSDRDRCNQLFNELWFVRDAFAHSFTDLKKIEYRGIPLEDCFGSTHLGRSHHSGGVSIFLNDFNSVFHPIIELFMTRQYEQLDARKFAAMCDEALRPRSLGP